MHDARGVQSLLRRTTEPAQRLHVSVDCDSRALTLQGELDMSSAATLDDAASLLMQMLPGDMTIDLGRVSFIDAGGLNGLIRIANAAGALGCALSIVGASPRLRRTFDLGGVGPLLTRPDEDAISAGRDPSTLLVQLATTIRSSLQHSADPVVVMGSLAELCVPDFSDACVIDVFEQGKDAVRVRGGKQPAHPRATTAGGMQICILVDGGFDRDDPAYSVQVVHSWTSHRPDDVDLALAHLLTMHAVAIVSRTRLAAACAASAADVKNLELALRNSRRIGAAIGIVMALTRATEEQAFALLTKASQRLSMKVRDLAEDIVLTGRIPTVPR